MLEQRDIETVNTVIHWTGTERDWKVWESVTNKDRGIHTAREGQRKKNYAKRVQKRVPYWHACIDIEINFSNRSECKDKLTCVHKIDLNIFQK